MAEMAMREAYGRALADYGELNPAVVFGAMKDKDCREMLAILSGIAGEYLFAPVANPRSSDPGDLLQHARVPAKTFPTLEAAVEAFFAALD